jgi:[acyl-carrier-protein] S-malonyltransferase
VTIANDNAPGQIVISGDKSAVDAAIAAIKEMGVRKAMMLPVSAPFHCPLMQPAADAMAEALADAQMSNPSVPVVTNVSAGPVSDAETLRAQLVEQVTGKVRWRESVDGCMLLAWSNSWRPAPRCCPPCSSGISKRLRAQR